MKRLIIVFIIAVSLSGFIPTHVEAATDPGLFVSMTVDYGTCSDSIYEIAISWTGSQNDAGTPYDQVGWIAYDANGVHIASDWNGIQPGYSWTYYTDFGSTVGMNDVTARPITIEVYDTVEFGPFDYNTEAVYQYVLDQAAAGAPLLISAVYDPANDQPDCGTLPFIDNNPIVTDGGINVPNRGMIMITAEQAQPAYTAPGGEVAKASDGADIILPYDWDSNGFDTYVVTEATDVGGRVWLSIFLGSEDFGWVPEDTVTAMTSLPQ